MKLGIAHKLHIVNRMVHCPEHTILAVSGINAVLPLAALLLEFQEDASRGIVSRDSSGWGVKGYVDSNDST